MTFDQQLWLLIIGAIMGFGFATIGAFIQHGLESRRYKRELKDQRDMLDTQLKHQQEMYERQIADQRSLFKEQLEMERELRQKDERIKALTSYESPVSLVERYTELRHEYRMVNVEHMARRLHVLKSLAEILGDDVPEFIVSMISNIPTEILNQLEMKIAEVHEQPEKKNELIRLLLPSPEEIERARQVLDESLFSPRVLIEDTDESAKDDVEQNSK